MDKEQFENAKNKIIGIDRQRQGIGTLSEKTLHAILKYYIESNEDFHEIPINGYVADIYRDGRIMEVQTANFDKLRAKLSVFLNEYEVTIVYPIPYEKWLSWLNVETGEMSKKRKSPKTGTLYEVFFQLYKIKPFLLNPNLRIKVLLINMEEIRMLNGWSYNKKRGSTRYDRIPVELIYELDIEKPEDYIQMVPIELPEVFLAKDYAKAAKINVRMAQLSLNILTYVGVVKRVGKSGNAILYHVSEW